MEESYYYLLDRFRWDKTEEEFVSKAKWIGAGTGDDSTLRVCLQRGTIIYWRQNRGFEQTIFDGKSLSEEEMEKVFELLEIKIYLKWK